MVAISRVLSILHMCIVIPVRWISAQTHNLGQYKWGARSMGRVLDIIEESMDEINTNHSLILSKDYMMAIFVELHDELPPFNGFCENRFEKQRMSVVRHTCTKVVHLARSRDELFAPVVEDNKNAGDTVETLAGIVSESFLQELRDTNKASYKYLTSSGSSFSYTHCPEEIRKDMIGKWATNDIAESCFGGVASHIQRYSRINISNAAAVSDMKRNKFFKRTGGDNAGLFH